MYESSLPTRVRPTYRESRWKERMDARAGTLLAHGYAPNTVAHHLREWMDFLRDYEADDATLPADVHELAVVEYLDRRCAHRKDGHRNVAPALRLIIEPDDVWRRRLPPQRQPTSALYDAIMPGFLLFARQHRGCRSMRPLEWVLRGFFGWLDTRGIEQAEELSSIHVRDYLANLSHLKPVTMAGHASVVRGLLRYLAVEGVVPAALALVVESPRVYGRRQPPEVLDEDTVERMLDAIDRSTAMGKRDFAVFLLAARYGLRPCDIRALRLDDIHWREQRIAIVQTKTKRPLELPLLDDVDNALVDYLRHGRPQCTARQVFVRHRAPIAPLGNHNSLWDVKRRTFRAAGV